LKPVHIKDVERKGILVKVYDVWAEWCSPCKRFAPIFEKVSEEFPDVDFVKVEADLNPEFLNKHSINSIPTILIVDEKEKVLFQHIGILSEENFRNLVSTFILQSHK
jgi:thioredoxin 1